MKRATITLPDEVEEALEAYRRSQDLPLPLTALTQTALREYLEKRGFAAFFGAVFRHHPEQAR